MADISKLKSHHQLLEDDLVNVDDADVPHIFNPFSPLNSSFFIPYNHQQVNPNPSSSCPSESDCPDSTQYDQLDFITDLFSSIHVGIRLPEASVNHDNDADSVSNGFNERELGLRVARIEPDSETEEFGQVSEQNDERDVLSSVSVSSDGEPTVGVLEWEILLAVSNLERDLELATDGGEGFVYTPEFDTLIGRFVETVRALRGGPPAGKWVIDSLPLVALEMGDDGVVCAVCKEEVVTGEEVRRLPCKHYYHGECIVPWLSIRNTCPVCRFELPTDDVDCEESKNRVGDDDGLRVGYGLDRLP